MFAFATHLLDVDQIYNFLPLLRPFSRFFSRLPKYSQKQAIRRAFPYKSFLVDKFKSAIGAESACLVILCPLFPEDFARTHEESVLRRLIKAGLYSEQRGAKIIGLGGFTSIVGNEGEVLANELEIGVTSGNTYTAALAIEGIFKAAEVLNIRMKNCQLAVIGATGDIGSVCSKALAKHFSRICLVARNEERLSNLKEEIKDYSETSFTTDVIEAVSNSEVILTVAGSATALFDSSILKKGAVVCDVAFPPNIARNISKFRKDVFVFEGGKVKIPNPDSIKNRLWHGLFSDGIVFGCFAETLVLAFEEKFEDFSVGRWKITDEKMRLITKMAQKHGFMLAPFRCGNFCYTDDNLRELRGVVNRSDKP